MDDYINENDVEIDNDYELQDDLQEDQLNDDNFEYNDIVDDMELEDEIIDGNINVDINVKNDSSNDLSDVDLSMESVLEGGIGVTSVEDFPVEVGRMDDKLVDTDMITIMNAEHDKNGFSGDHIKSMNTFMTRGLYDIITKQFKAEVNNYKNTRDKTDEDKQISHYSFSVQFTSVKLRAPTTTRYRSATTEMMTPNMARIQDATYSAALEVSAKIVATAFKHTGEKIVKEDVVKDFRISSIPVMIRSEICNTYGMPKEMLKKIEEDIQDPGGYFIVHGTEWVIDSLENIANNKFHVYKKSYNDEIARGNFISKPGDSYENSRQILIRYLSTGAITVEMTTGKLDGIQIPFYLLFRLLGINRDDEIVSHIVYGVDNTDIVSKQMYKILEKAFLIEDPKFWDLRQELDVTKITNKIAHRILEGIVNQNYKNNENSLRYFHNRFESMMDESLLPHVGLVPMARKRKAKFLGHLIHTLIKVSMGILESTDRDSYANKRLTPAGVSLSKAFKTHFNIVVIQEVKTAFTNAFATTQFKQLNLADIFKSAIKTQDLERLLVQSITSGNKTITVKRSEIPNRVSSQMYEHKNDLNKKSQLNSIVTPSSTTNKQNERADVMRRVHATYLGYICTSQSADSGAKVGVNKQKALVASVSEATDSYILKKELMREKSLIVDFDSKEIYERKLAKVFVNGDWIGCVEKAHELVYLYRMKRRFGDNINYTTTIIWEPLVREVHFWTDVGRLLRPLIIVYNNIDEYNKWVMGGKKGDVVEFRQWIKVTKKHIVALQKKEITIDDLRKERVIEYISSEELLNCFLAKSLDSLLENINDITKPYTHCDIPLAIFGLAAASSPFANHSSGVRVTYHTNQKKQTAGWFALNWPFMLNKGTFLQYYCDYPIVRTYPDKLTHPNGQNVILALQCYSGYNQEDSAIINKSSVERGLYQGSKFDVERTELEQNEEFGNPDFTKTMDIKKAAIYDYIEDGFIKKGTIVHKGYVLIVKTARIPKPTTEFLYMDKSIIYKNDEPAIVEEVILPRSDEGVLSAKIKLRMYRPIRKGDKCCVTDDHEVLTTNGWVSISKVSLFDRIATLVDGELKYEYPTNLYVYDHSGEMYSVESSDVDLFTTMNHKMYVRLDGESKYKLIEAENIINEKVTYKKNVDRYEEKSKSYKEIGGVRFLMNDWLELLGIYLNDGWCSCKVESEINIMVSNSEKFNKLSNVCSRMGLKLNSIHDTKYVIKNDALADSFRNYYKIIPNDVFELSRSQARILLNSIVDINDQKYESFMDNCYFNNIKNKKIYTTPSMALCDGLMRLALHCGYSADYYKYANKLDYIMVSSVNKHKLIMKNMFIGDKYITDIYVVTINYGVETETVKETIVDDFVGKVYCLEVPSHIFYIRRNNKACWTGNSSRTGNKGIIGSMLDQADMPYAEDGMVPDIIVNPHSIPSRMAIGQILETVVGTLGLAIGKVFDSTCFKKVDIYELIERLEKLGIKYGGKKRLFNGMTGCWIDTHIVMCPNTYQRLLKFIDDDSYYVNRGPTNATTHQPVDGRVNRGGLRMGEMEEWVIAAHGSMRVLNRKFYEDSDGTVIQICRRCGNKAVVNIQKNIYRCKYCIDKADIVNVPTSWMMNIFTHMLSSMNVKTDFEIDPYIYSRLENTEDERKVK